jgi:hypothetical protein
VHFYAWAFFLVFMLGCQQKHSLTNTISPFFMSSHPCSPNSERDRMPDRQYAIWAKGTNGAPSHLLDDYIILFEEYDLNGNGPSLDEHVQNIIKMKGPTLPFGA